MPTLALEQVLEQADRLPAFPQIVFRILDELADESADVDRLTAHIASDPAVVARLLAAANSASVAHGQRVASVQQAVIMLGVARVCNIVTTTAIIDRYSISTGLDSAQLWRHSVGVALCAQQIATHAGLNPEIAYTAGLLHDVGRLLLYAVDPAGYARVIAEQHENDLDLVEAELLVLGLEHSAIGGALAQRWKLPQDVASAIADHHATDEHPPVNEMADTVHVAEILCAALDLGIDPAVRNDWLPRVPPVSELACARLGIDWSRFGDHFPLIEARFDAARLSLLL